jgi:hypothetical protein
MEKDRGKCCLTFRVYQYMSAYLSIYQYIIYIYVYVCSISILHILQEVLQMDFRRHRMELGNGHHEGAGPSEGWTPGMLVDPWWIPRRPKRGPNGWLISSQNLENRMEK